MLSWQRVVAVAVMIGGGVALAMVNEPVLAGTLIGAAASALMPPMGRSNGNGS